MIILMGITCAGIAIREGFAEGSNSTAGITYSEEAKENTLVGAALHRGRQRIYIYTKSGIPAHRGVTVTRLFYEREKVHASICLFSAERKEIAKTRRGRAMEKPLIAQGNTPVIAFLFFLDRRRFLPIVHVEDDPDQIGSIDLKELFDIPKSGKYTLTLGLRIYKETKRDHLEPISMPPLTLEVELEKPE